MSHTLLSEPDAVIQKLTQAHYHITHIKVAFLDDRERGKKEVLALSDRVLSLGIHSIPTLIVDSTLVISGAQRSDVVLTALRQAVDRGPTGKRIFGDIRVV